MNREEVKKLGEELTDVGGPEEEVPGKFTMSQDDRAQVYEALHDVSEILDRYYTLDDEVMESYGAFIRAIMPLLGHKDYISDEEAEAYVHSKMGPYAEPD